MTLSPFDLLVNFLQSLCLGFLANFYLNINKKYSCRVLVACLSLLMFFQVTFFNLSQEYEGFSLIFYVITLSGFGIIFSDNNPLECISLGFIVLIMMSAVNIFSFMVTDILTFIFQVDSVDGYLLIAKTCAVFFMALFSWIIVKLRNKLSYLEYKMFSLYLAILIIANLIITLLETMYYGGELLVDYLEYSLLLMILLSLVITKMFFDLQNKYWHFHQVAITHEQLDKLSVCFSEINDREKRIASLKHDMQNIIALIKSLVVAGEYEKAISIMNTKSDEIAQVEALIYTGNVMIDSVVNSKKSMAAQQGINMKVVFYPLQFCDELALDICALLYLSLDNAIENCSKTIPSIKLLLENKEDLFVIRVINYVSHDVLKDNPYLNTTKKDKTYHGYGILNMKQIIDKHNGYLFFNQEKDEFECKIILPLKTDCK